jgi:hypothetical protein
MNRPTEAQTRQMIDKAMLPLPTNDDDYDCAADGLARELSAALTVEAGASRSIGVVNLADFKFAATKEFLAEVWAGKHGDFADVSLTALTPASSAVCAARSQGSAGGNDPADCDWPFCGCDPHADKVLAALQECGWSTPASSAVEGETVAEYPYMTENVATPSAFIGSPAPTPAGDAPTHRHKKRGSEYVLIGIGNMQCDWWQVIGDGSRYPVDMREVAIYRSVSDGSMWVRPRDEFEDGRFEALPAAPAPHQEGRK